MEKSTLNEAVVIGSSIAGLTAASVLQKYFKKVNLIDRYQLATVTAISRGIPQARHAHILHPRGHIVMERLFPGLVEEMVGMGAIVVDPSSDIATFSEGKWLSPRKKKTRDLITCSRPLLEEAIYRRVKSLEGVSFLHGYDAVGLVADKTGDRVIGARLRSRDARDEAETVLEADLVLDASGRNSRAPYWLKALGFKPPEEWKIDAHVGYTTRLYRRPEGFDAGWKSLYVLPTPPDGRRGALILSAENQQWFVTLIGMDRDYPPVDENGFLDFARSLPTEVVTEAIESAKPISKPYGFRRTENRVRRYDALPRHLEGFLVSGDAVYALDPVSAQGMTAAAMGSQILERCLEENTDRSDITGLASRFQAELARDVGRLFQIMAEREWEWPGTEIDDNIEDLYPA